ncbi:MAG: NmrA family NAD(P)-binding protein [Chroococcidiopsidaceae cyanobacterium CP_BM_RX_35]|nr:NmrA family NAD(P)-binding protein [Chroococcidiopsidaceae cyanobacterium CP_BM_RX_35]
MKVLMVGATGRFANLVIPELKQQGVSIRALVRSKDKIDTARQQGADEAIVGDLSNADSLCVAASGMEGVFHLNPAFAPNEAELGVAMVEAAKASGVIHPSLSSLGNHAGKPPVEEALYDSGMNFTVLQPTIFMQNFDIDWQSVMEKGQFALPFSKYSQDILCRLPRCRRSSCSSTNERSIRLRHIRAM